MNIARIAPAVEKKALVGSEGALIIWSSVLNIIGVLVIVLGIGAFLMEMSAGSIMIMVWCLAAGVSSLISGAVLRALAEIVVLVRAR